MHVRFNRWTFTLNDTYNWKHGKSGGPASNMLGNSWYAGRKAAELSANKPAPPPSWAPSLPGQNAGAVIGDFVGDFYNQWKNPQKILYDGEMYFVGKHFDVRTTPQDLPKDSQWRPRSNSC